MDLFEQVLLFFISILANTFSAYAGGGAGLLQLPALIFLGLPFAMALATHKIASVALGVGAAIRHTQEKKLQWRFALFILITGVVGVVPGARFILTIPENIANLALGIMTVGLAIYSWHRPDMGVEANNTHRDQTGYMIGGTVLLLIGFLNGSLTSGTGLFCTLWLVRWFGLDYKLAVAYTLVVVGIFWNGTGAFTLTLLGTVQWSWLPVLILGSVIGGYAGAHLAIKSHSRSIKRAFELVTFLTGLALIVKALIA
ncbi:MAG: sulfite exporter TauE/SafE family protein [Gammaproteobacteria bacterium]|nr:sulfite exporter TauE/SafE family protein [Gammaproteobacteria bacterium]